MTKGLINRAMASVFMPDHEPDNNEDDETISWDCDNCYEFGDFEDEDDEEDE